jgi:Domain of unknown function (DUF4336)
MEQQTMPGVAIDVTYPPLDVLKPVAENVWIVDSGPLRLMGLSLPLRMTVIRLSSGGLWLHSPTRFDAALRDAMERLGPIRHLVAPTIAHWSFIEGWQRHCPEAITWAAPNLRRRPQVRKAGLRLDRDLDERAPEDWAGDIAQTIIPGGGGYREVAFFHHPTATLVLTDLIVNLEPAKLPPASRIFGRLTGALAPDGKAPAYLRLIVRLRRAEAAAAAARVTAWGPERVIFAHGRWFERDATSALKRSLRWLLG